MNLFRKSYRGKTDEELMDLISGGKKQAFEELYNRYNQKLFSFINKLLNYNEELSNDLLHDIFLKIIEKPHLFNPGMKFSTWIYTVASNMCKNEYRRSAVRKSVTVNTESDLELHYFEEERFSFDTDNKLFMKRLSEELDNFSIDQKLTFTLRYFQHLSVKEISEILECPEGTVKSRLFYTLKKLAENLSIFNPASGGNYGRK